VYGEFFLVNLVRNSRVESAENRSAHFDSVMIGGQQPALKRVMRGITESTYWARTESRFWRLWGPKIDPRVIG